jgi:hypothetical protein
MKVAEAAMGPVTTTCRPACHVPVTLDEGEGDCV